MLEAASLRLMSIISVDYWWSENGCLSFPISVELFSWCLWCKWCESVAMFRFSLFLFVSWLVWVSAFGSVSWCSVGGSDAVERQVFCFRETMMLTFRRVWSWKKTRWRNFVGNKIKLNTWRFELFVDVFTISLILVNSGFTHLQDALGCYFYFSFCNALDRNYLGRQP